MLNEYDSRPLTAETGIRKSNVTGHQVTSVVKRGIDDVKTDHLAAPPARSMNALLAALERNLDDDRKFFRHRRHRRYRLSSLFDAERKQAELTGTLDDTESRHFTVAEQLRPVVRIGTCCTGPHDLSAERSDEAIALAIATVGGHA